MLANEGKRFTTIPCKDQSPEWLEVRKSGVGGSEVAAILGLNPYKGAYTVWAEKLGYIEVADLSSKEAVRWGHILEPVVAHHYQELHPDQRIVNPQCVMRSIERPWAQASVDRLIRDPTRGWGVLEIKTAGLRSAPLWEEGVPDGYLCQVTHYLAVTGYEWACVAVLIGGQEYREYVIERDEADIALVSDAVDAFWHDSVEGLAEPEITEQGSEAQMLANRHLSGDGTYTQADRLVRDYISAKDLEADAKASKQEIATKIKNLVAKAGSEGITDSAGIRIKWSRTPHRNSLRVLGAL